MRKDRNELIDSILQFLHEQQKDAGEFAAMEKYRHPHPDADKDWLYTSPSPFIHSNILYCLIGLQHPLATKITNKGISFLLTVIEKYQGWRYWRHDSPNFNIPMDTDDTALASFVLEKNGIALGNKWLLESCIRKDNRIQTWICPSTKMLFRPMVWRFFKKDIKKASKEVFEQGMLSLDDTEPAVVSNVLLYLGGSTKMVPVVQRLVDDLKENQDFPLYFYEDKLMAYYHVSRAFANGVSGLFPLREMILDHVKTRYASGKLDFFQSIIALNISLYLKSEKNLRERLWQVIDEEMGRNDFSWQAYPYFCSKNRIFSGGSPELTAAFFLKALIFQDEGAH